MFQRLRHTVETAAGLGTRSIDVAARAIVRVEEPAAQRIEPAVTAVTATVGGLGVPLVRRAADLAVAAQAEVASVARGIGIASTAEVERLEARVRDLEMESEIEGRLEHEAAETR
jgi:Glu-tRNA(Gln) amidotransferase subunit E-like FAD-binding protein